MAQDIRNIILSLDEVLSAFACYQRVTPAFLPGSAIVGCKTLNNAIVLSVETLQDDIKQNSELCLAGIDLMRPLIRFCIENNIMLPREGRKSLMIESDKIIMHIELDLNAEMPATVSPMHLKHLEMIRNQRAEKTVISA
jgi:hypothetical protein